MVYYQRMIEALPLCWLAAVSLSAVRAEPAPLPPPSAHPVDFIQDVQPILASTCLSCHGPEKQRADYRLDLKSTALTGGADHAPNIIPGNSAESPLIQFVASLDPDQRMPPKKDPLSPAHIGILRRWIDDGASWPEEASAAVPDKTDWWSLRPLVKSTAPAMPEGGRNAVDAFIAATLKTKNLSLSSEADARTLCRRLYFDLTGLPPSPEEVEQFVRRYQSETGPDAAWQELVDTLLASPRYGERWARHWLDVVHFGETHGFDKDQPRPHAWPYRDYVIRSFNADKPYSRFVQEQIAGDILFPGTLDGITALGFIAAGPWDLIGHAEVGEEKIDGKIARHLDRDDMVANTLNTFSAMTVHCAQCHDHKFDPISADDYYSLQSVFAAVDRADRPYDDDDATAARRTSLHLVACFVRDLADMQLKPVGFSVLCLVGHNPGITSRQLCQTLDIQAPNLVGLVSALTERGCLERLPHPTDGRAWGLHLTPAGESLLAQAESRILASEQQACAGLSTAEQATLKQLLQKIYLS